MSTLEKLHSLYRGTKNFEIEVSEDGTTWEKALRGRLQRSWDVGCDVPIETFYVGSLTHNFLRFKALPNSYYGSGPGLMFLGTDNGENGMYVRLLYVQYGTLPLSSMHLNAKIFMIFTYRLHLGAEGSN